jgi:arabinan endo-1,5-alpha-L-arabinosidase
MWSLVALFVSTQTVAQPRHFKRADFQTTTPMVHDPVMALEDSTWHIFATGMGIQQMTSKDRKTWTVKADPVMTVIPKWAHDSVPGFTHHVWAPDVIRWHNRWWMAYSCSTFGRNGSAIGLLSTRSLASGLWDDEGCIVCSHEGRDNWNAIDPNFVIDDQDQPWLVWGSFWDGIQLVRLDTTMHVAKESGARSQESVKPKTIARRFNLTDPDGKKALSVNPNPPKNPTSDYAGPNAIEAPFIFKHDGWYYLFVSWDYCCQGAKSNYRVAVGRSRSVEGPYLDPEGKDMRDGGGKIFLEGDKKEYEAVGHCAAYNIDGQDIFICHGYSVAQEGASVLIQRPISWTPDGWPTLNKTK